MLDHLPPPPLSITSRNNSGNRLSATSSSETIDLVVKMQSSVLFVVKSGELLNRSITHASYPLDNNRALAVPGLDAMGAAVAVLAIGADLDVSSQSLNRRIEAATGGKPCAAGGRRLGPDKVVKVAGGPTRPPTRWCAGCTVPSSGRWRSTPAWLMMPATCFRRCFGRVVDWCLICEALECYVPDWSVLV